MSAVPLSTGSGERVPLRPLALVDEGDDVLVGDPDAGTFVAVPAVGAVVIRALQGGATIGEAAAQAERQAGEPVDVASFVDSLRELGFVDESAESAAEDGARPRRTAPIQQRRWITGPLRQHHARVLFSPAAWCCYAAALLFCIACFALRPDLWPRAGDVFVLGDNVLSVVLALLASYLLAAVHEAWHWLGARSLGLSARFGVDRRLYFLVFETDLSQLWGVPRRQRYGPQLAGLAIDSVNLAALLAVQVAAGAGWLARTAGLGRLLAMLVFLQVAGMLWQCMLFLRTDLYGVLVTATGCRNLWEIKSLLLRQALGRLTPEQAAELAAADPRDLRAGRWFRWLYLAGFLAALAYFGYFLLPVLVSLLAWSAGGLAAGPARARFWLTAAGSALLYLPLLGVLGLWLASRRRPAAPRP
jgi:hypothetical protein